MSCITKTGNVY